MRAGLQTGKKCRQQVGCLRAMPNLDYLAELDRRHPTRWRAKSTRYDGKKPRLAPEHPVVALNRGSLRISHLARKVE